MCPYMYTNTGKRERELSNPARIDCAPRFLLCAAWSISLLFLSSTASAFVSRGREMAKVARVSLLSFNLGKESKREIERVYRGYIEVCTRALNWDHGGISQPPSDGS